MAHKMVEALQAVLNVLENSGDNPATSEGATNNKKTNDQASDAQNKDSIRRGRNLAAARMAIASKKGTKAKSKQETNKPVYQNEEIKRLRSIIEQRKEAQKKKNDKADVTASTSASSSKGNKESISPKRKTKVEGTDRPIVMTEEMKRIKLRIEQKKQSSKNKTSGIATSRNISRTPNMTSTDETTSTSSTNTRGE